MTNNSINKWQRRSAMTFVPRPKYRFPWLMIAMIVGVSVAVIGAGLLVTMRVTER